MRILVVDDAEMVRSLMEDYLGSLGHEVVALESGDNVAHELERGPFDAVFTDVRMPGWSGWQVLDIVRAARPGLPVVLISGLDVPDGSAASGQQPNAIINKPFDLNDVRAVLDALGPGA